MKTISIRNLHDRTGECIRQAEEYGEVFVTARGRIVAKISPAANPQITPYFSNRRLSPAFRKLIDKGRLRGGTDSTEIISQERDARFS
jgi:antitoxin (DNA-binding transcriptional repressor) of toxin-antitoxin stability system